MSHSRDLPAPDHTEQISSSSENEKADKAPETSKTPYLISRSLTIL